MFTKAPSQYWRKVVGQRDAARRVGRCRGVAERRLALRVERNALTCAKRRFWAGVEQLAAVVEVVADREDLVVGELADTGPAGHPASRISTSLPVYQTIAS